jgi:hypothetical protein
MIESCGRSQDRGLLRRGGRNLVDLPSALFALMRGFISPTRICDEFSARAPRGCGAMRFASAPVSRRLVVVPTCRQCPSASTSSNTDACTSGQNQTNDSRHMPSPTRPCGRVPLLPRCGRGLENGRLQPLSCTAGEGAERSEAGEGAPVPSVRFAPLVLTSPRSFGDCSMVLGVGLLDSDGIFTTIVAPDSIGNQDSRSG